MRPDRNVILEEIGFAWKGESHHNLNQNEKLWHQLCMKSWCHRRSKRTDYSTSQLWTKQLLYLVGASLCRNFFPPCLLKNGRKPYSQVCGNVNARMSEYKSVAIVRANSGPRMSSSKMTVYGTGTGRLP
jgi:hypothetical protein